MKLCRTCKWWTQPVRLTSHYAGAGICQGQEMITAGVNQGMDADACLIVTNDLTNTELRTMPEFGCVHHEEK